MGEADRAGTRWVTRRAGVARVARPAVTAIVPAAAASAALLVAALALAAPAAPAPGGAVGTPVAPAPVGTGATLPEPPAAIAAPRYYPPLVAAPLDPPLRLSATFGEYRPGHFHAGVDFSTGERIGRPVFAALAGAVVRVRASGVGYGRSIYVESGDGRLLVYAHLDAFDEPLASFVDSVQAATAEYEQDLWPAAGRFPVRAGQRLGWSGRSGTDAPHLHFEIRHGDVAYNPLLAGLAVEDTARPAFRRVALAPVPAPDRPAAGGWALETMGRDTALIAGPSRIVAEVADARANGRRTMAPWRVVLRTEADEVECRFDSVSWAEGMSEVDFVYDRGRSLPAEGRQGIVLGAPAGFRPRVLRARAPAGAEAGTLQVPPGGRPLLAWLLAQDAAGNAATEALALDAGPSPARSEGNPPGAWADPDRAAGASGPGWEWSAAAGTLFEGARIEVTDLGRAEGNDDLAPRSHVFAWTPSRTPLRRALRVSLRSSRADRAARASERPPAVALYRDSGDGWERVDAAFAGRDGWIGAESRSFGRFALFADALAPRVRRIRAPRVPPEGAYPRWALEIAVEERGSGVDARATTLAVDGRRVPVEWDAVESTLRWRPARPPGPGRHSIELDLRDRAGNARLRRAHVVLDSGAHDPRGSRAPSETTSPGAP